VYKLQIIILTSFTVEYYVGPKSQIIYYVIWTYQTH